MIKKLLLLLALSTLSFAHAEISSPSSDSTSIIQVATPAKSSNIFLENGTTTNTNDSVNITSGNGALGGANPGYIAIPHQTTAGAFTIFTVTADVKILLTGATWGFAGKGDITGAIFRVYAINDNGTLKWGIAYQGGRNSIADTATSATQASVDLPEEILVNSALSSGTWPMVEVGWFRADFDDTGGAAEDLYALQTGVDDYNLGSADGYYQPWNTTWAGFSANPTCTTTWTQQGSTVFARFITTVSGTSNATTLTCTLPVKSKYTVVSSTSGVITDNGATGTTPPRFALSATSVTATMTKSLDGGAWTNANGKAFNTVIEYETN